MQFTTLALGGTVNVPTLDGTHALDIPEGTQPGTSLRFVARACRTSRAVATATCM